MKKLVISTLFVMQVFFVFAQSPTGISGKVLDAKSQIPLHILHYMKKIEEQINDIDKDCKNDEEFNKEFENDWVTKKLLNIEKFVESISSYFNFQ